MDVTFRAQSQAFGGCAEADMPECFLGSWMLKRLRGACYKCKEFLCGEMLCQHAALLPFSSFNDHKITLCFFLFSFFTTGTSLFFVSTIKCKDSSIWVWFGSQLKNVWWEGRVSEQWLVLPGDRFEQHRAELFPPGNTCGYKGCKSSIQSVPFLLPQKCEICCILRGFSWLKVLKTAIKPAWWCTRVVLATQGAEVVVSLEPRSLRLAWAA
jgi:hypothetical protein